MKNFKKFFVLLILLFTTTLLFACAGDHYYMVSFDADGGAPIPEFQMVQNGRFASEPEFEPTKEGYTFQGWYFAGNKFDFQTPILLNLVLVAQWDAVAEYSITFNSNGGSEILGQIVRSGRRIVQPIPPIKEGLKFAGWFKEESLTTRWDFANDLVSADITLYAKWIDLDTIVVIFNSNGGSPVGEFDGKFGSLVTKPNDPIKEGYLFAGWFDIKQAKQWDFAKDLINKEENFTLYAIWIAKVVNVKFDSNGGSDVLDEATSFNELITKPTDPIKEGYNFVGWYDEELEVPWNFSNDLISQEELTLYAKWSAKSVIVTFDSNDGSDVPDFSGVYDGLITKPNDPTKEGYNFAGWFKDEDLLNQWNFSDDVINQEEHLTLYAKWVVDSYTINFETNSSIILPAAVVAANYTIELEGLTLNGKTFIGWYLDNKFTSEVISSLEVTSDLTLYARWIDVDDVIITDPASNLQEVIDDAAVGSSIFLMPGVYVVERLTISKSLTILGNNYDGSNNKEASIIVPVLKANFQEHGTHVIMVSAPDVVINGIVVDGDNPFEENIWSLAQQNFLEEYRASAAYIASLETRSSAVLDAVIAHYKTMVGKDIKLDIAIGICVDTNFGVNDNFTLINSEVKNFFQSGIYVYSGASGTSQVNSETLGKVTIKDNTFDNINVLTVLYNQAYLGHYGRAIEFSYGIYGDISGNTINDSSVGIQIQNNYKNEYPLLINNNKLNNVNTGIWFNESAVNSQTIIFDNDFTYDNTTPLFFIAGQNAAIAISSLSFVGTDARLLITTNNVSGYQYGILLGSLNANGTLDVIDNSFNNLVNAYAVTDFFMSYKVTGGVYVNIHENEYQNVSEVFFKQMRGKGQLIRVYYYENGLLVNTDISGTLATVTNLKIAGTNVTWNSVLEATAYEVYINDILVATTTQTLYSLLEINGDSKIEVVAISDEPNVFDSDKSAAVNVIKITIETDTYKTNNEVTSVTTDYYYYADKTTYATLLKVIPNNYESDLDWAIKGYNEPFVFNPQDFFATSNHFYRAVYQVVKLTVYLRGALVADKVVEQSLKVNTLIDLYTPVLEDYMIIEGYYTNTGLSNGLLIDENNQHKMIAAVNIYLKIVDLRLKTPTGLKISSSNLIWTKVADAIAYEVYANGVMVNVQSELSYSLLNLTEDTTFYVVAIPDESTGAQKSQPSLEIKVIKVVTEVESVTLAGASTFAVTTSYLVSGSATYLSKLPVAPKAGYEIAIDWQIKDSGVDFTYEEGALIETSATFYRKLDQLVTVTYYIRGALSVDSYLVVLYSKGTAIDLLEFEMLQDQSVEIVSYYSNAAMTSKYLIPADEQLVLTASIKIYIDVVII